MLLTGAMSYQEYRTRYLLTVIHNELGLTGNFFIAPHFVEYMVYTFPKLGILCIIHLPNVDSEHFRQQRSILAR